MKHTHWIYAVIAILSLWACSAEGPDKDEQLTIVSWNVQNLFDGIDNGFEHDEFKNSAGWNNEKYRARLNSIAEVFKGDNGIVPDIFALIEVENAAVIQTLAETMNCQWAFFAGAPEGPTGVGIVSKLPLTETMTHSFHSPDGSTPRPVAEVWVQTGAGPIVLLVCHWKSKLGGERKTEALRQAGAALVARRLAEIAAENAKIPVIILGDLNENYDEFTRIGEAYPCALLPDSEEAAALSKKTAATARPGFQDFLVVSGQKPPRTEFFTQTTVVVYSPWLEESFADWANEGSYYYKEAWETIDHFLLNAALFNQQEYSAYSAKEHSERKPLSSGTFGWHYEGFRVQAAAPFTNAAGLPQPYNPGTGNGLSDHLPIVLMLKRK